MRERNPVLLLSRVAMPAAISIWTAAILASRLSLGGYGLIGGLHPAWYAAVALAVTGMLAAIATRRHSVLLTAYAITILVMIVSTGMLLEQGPRFPYIYRSYTYGDQILRTGVIDYSQSYMSWPGWHVATAVAVGVSGVDPDELLTWIPLWLALHHARRANDALSTISAPPLPALDRSRARRDGVRTADLSRARIDGVRPGSSSSWPLRSRSTSGAPEPLAAELESRPLRRSRRYASTDVDCRIGRRHRCVVLGRRCLQPPARNSRHLRWRAYRGQPVLRRGGSSPPPSYPQQVETMLHLDRLLRGHLWGDVDERRGGQRRPYARRTHTDRLRHRPIRARGARRAGRDRLKAATTSMGPADRLDRGRNRGPRRRRIRGRDTRTRLHARGTRLARSRVVAGAHPGWADPGRHGNPGGGTPKPDQPLRQRTPRLRAAE